MEKKNVVYIVDEHERTCEIVSHVLTDYDVKNFLSGQSLLDALENDAPDLIMLNVNMPKPDGLVVCRKIKKNTSLSHIPIIFFSSNDTLEDRLKGYGAGGDDYIGKPFDPTELSLKVETAIRQKRQYEQAKSQAEEASVSALDIMSTLSEHSIVLHFMQSILNCASYRQLALDLIDSINGLDLSIVIEFSVEDKREYYSTNNDESDLEKSVFDYVRDKKHIVDVGQRCAFNYPAMSILVRNMPTDNPSLHGRLRDHISVIGRAAESKLLSLKKDMAMYEQRNGLIEILTQLQTTVCELESEYTTQQDKTRDVFADVNIKMEAEFMALGLTEEQEDKLRELINSGGKLINELFDDGLSIEQRFSIIATDIEKVLNQSAVEEPKPSDTPENKTSDIEFF